MMRKSKTASGLRKTTTADQMTRTRSLPRFLRPFRSRKPELTGAVEVVEAEECDHRTSIMKVGSNVSSHVSEEVGVFDQDKYTLQITVGMSTDKSVKYSEGSSTCSPESDESFEIQSNVYYNETEESYEAAVLTRSDDSSATVRVRTAKNEAKETSEIISEMMSGLNSKAQASYLDASTEGYRRTASGVHSDDNVRQTSIPYVVDHTDDSECTSLEDLSTNEEGEREQESAFDDASQQTKSQIDAGFAKDRQLCRAGGKFAMLDSLRKSMTRSKHTNKIDNVVQEETDRVGCTEAVLNETIPSMKATAEAMVEEALPSIRASTESFMAASAAAFRFLEGYNLDLYRKASDYFEMYTIAEESVTLDDLVDLLREASSLDESEPSEGSLNAASYHDVRKKPKWLTILNEASQTHKGDAGSMRNPTSAEHANTEQKCDDSFHSDDEKSDITESIASHGDLTSVGTSVGEILDNLKQEERFRKIAFREAFSVFEKNKKNQCDCGERQTDKSKENNNDIVVETVYDENCDDGSVISSVSVVLGSMIKSIDKEPSSRGDRISSEGSMLSDALMATKPKQTITMESEDVAERVSQASVHSSNKTLYGSSPTTESTGLRTDKASTVAKVKDCDDASTSSWISSSSRRSWRFLNGKRTTGQTVIEDKKGKNDDELDTKAAVQHATTSHREDSRDPEQVATIEDRHFMNKNVGNSCDATMTRSMSMASSTASKDENSSNGNQSKSSSTSNVGEKNIAKKYLAAIQHISISPVTEQASDPPNSSEHSLHFSRRGVDTSNEASAKVISMQTEKPHISIVPREHCRRPEESPKIVNKISSESPRKAIPRTPVVSVDDDDSKCDEESVSSGATIELERKISGPPSLRR